MKLLTKVIKSKAHKQYEQGSDMEQMVVAKYFDPMGTWKWYLMNLDPEDSDYAWGIVKGNAIEMGSWQMSELQKVQLKPFGHGIERDLYFEPMKAGKLWDALQRGDFI